MFFFRNFGLGFGFEVIKIMLVLFFRLIFICCFLLYCMVGFRVVLLFFIVMLYIFRIVVLINGFIFNVFFDSWRNELN